MNLLLGFITSVILLFLSVLPINAQQGCCSWHGGISHCSNGRYVCNDGTYSPTCTCYSPPPINLPKTPPSTSPDSVKWCGAGEWFDSKSEADNSLVSFKEDIENPLISDITTLESERDNFQLKAWANFILLLTVPILVYVRNEWKFAKGLLYIIFYILFFGGILFLIPNF